MYRIHNSISGDKIIVLDQGSVCLSFGENPENSDYQRYLAWLADGGEPEIVQ